MKKIKCLLVLFGLFSNVSLTASSFLLKRAPRYLLRMHQCFISTLTEPRVPIKITDNAWKKMEYILDKTGKSSFEFSAESGGCNGFNYVLKALDEESTIQYLGGGSKIGITMIEKGSVKVIIEPTSEMFLLGTNIDYTSADYDKGIFESKFVFVPDKNFASSCGCGISFSPK
tara:strand:+ start:238 stop:753 length:516 start_codon:yes stop_codon:yes gene_type:complete